ncbi:MAG TPA: ROK family protein [Acidimicrobiales bacterium]
MEATIGIDIGGTKCLGVVADRQGMVQAEYRVATPRTGDDLVSAIVGVIAELRARVPGPHPPVGVGAPGLVDEQGVLRFAPNLPSVLELPIAARLRGSLPSGTAVTVGNDASCAAWAEHTCGAAAGVGHVLLATIGTGIGGGIVSGGRLQVGRHGFAGEIGHVVVDPRGPRCPCGQQGCWERYASGSGLGWMGREAAQAGQADQVVALAGGDPEAVRGEHVTTAAAAGDRQAAAVMARFAWWLALGLANLANVLDPELIVLGGGMVEAGSVLLDPAREAFAALLEGAAHRPAIDIVAAGLGERAGAIGAALVAGG